jgi:hypothetical protein
MIRMSKFEQIRDMLADSNPEALFADGFEDALVGVGYRCGQPSLAVYDYELAVKVLIERDDMEYEEAVEFLEFNSVGAWMGEHTPVWLIRGEPDA